MAGGDTAPDAAAAAAFKNVPRRARSAARPIKEDLGSNDGSPGRGGSCAPAPAPARNKKRTSPECGASEQRVHRRAEKRHRLLPTEDAKNGGGGGATPAPSRKDEGAAATASASTSTVPPVDWAEKERIRKGKMRAVKASPPQMTALDVDGKLMGDAIRSYGVTAAAASFEIKPHRSKRKPKPNSKKRKDQGPPFWCGMGPDKQATSSAGSDLDNSFHNLGVVVSDALRGTLGRLGVAAAAPERVYGKMLAGCDRNPHQSRMQMSCKSWLRDAARGEFPLSAFLTAPEKAAARTLEGLRVPKAYDRRGVAYEITVRYLDSNRSYRLMKDWGKFLKENGLVVTVVPGPRDVMVDLWMFRTPGGELGMVMMHYFKGDAAHADAAFDEEEARGLLDNDAAGVKVEEEEAPSPPEPDGAGKAGGAPIEVAVVVAPLSPDVDGTKMEEEEAGGAPTTEAAAQSSSLEATAGGAAKEAAAEEETGSAPEQGEANGTKTKVAEEKEASAPTTEAAAQPSSSSDAGDAAKAVGKEAGVPPGEEATRPSSPPVAGGGAKKASGAAALSLRFGLSEYEVSAADALVLLSTGYMGPCVK